jgi:hypothetical protein
MPALFISMPHGGFSLCIFGAGLTPLTNITGQILLHTSSLTYSRNATLKYILTELCYLHLILYITSFEPVTAS